MLAINGRYLRARATGVQRVAAALVRELDLRSSSSEAATWRMLRPAETRSPGLARIKDTALKGLPGQLWEQVDLPSRTRGAVLLSLCNTAPLSHPSNVVMIHDAQVFSSPASYSLAFRTWYRMLLPQIGRRALKVLTVSEYSRSELIRWGIAEAVQIEVIPNGVDHLVSVRPDEAIVTRLGLKGRPFVLALSSTQTHKNVQVLLRAFNRRELAGAALVLAGRDGAPALYRAGLRPPAQTVFTGIVTDAELAALMKSADAFGCPSLTEGFGLPPLEAMSLGCPVVAAPEGALLEVCGDAAIFADARDPRAWAEALAAVVEGHDEVGAARRKARAARYTWQRSGERLLRVLRSVGA